MCACVSIALLCIYTHIFNAQNLLSLDHCIGIIGGKPKHSVYFVGFQGRYTVYTYNMYIMKFNIRLFMKLAKVLSNMTCCILSQHKIYLSH